MVDVIGLVTRLEPEASALGLGVSAVAVLVMPVLAWRKRLANRTIGSSALRADIAETITCAYMAAATLVGVGLNLLAGLWWAEYVAAFALLVFIVREAREAVEASPPRRPPGPRRLGPGFTRPARCPAACRLPTDARSESSPRSSASAPRFSSQFAGCQAACVESWRSSAGSCTTPGAVPGRADQR